MTKKQVRELTLLQGRDLEAEIDVEVMEVFCLLAGFPRFAYLFSKKIQDYLLRSGTTHCGLGPPPLIEKIPTSTEALSSLMTSLYKVDTKLASTVISFHIS